MLEIGILFNLFTVDCMFVTSTTENSEDAALKIW